MVRPCNTSQTVLHTQTLKQTSSRASLLHEHKTQNHRTSLTNTELASQQSSRWQIPRQVWSIHLCPRPPRKTLLRIYFSLPRTSLSLKENSFPAHNSVSHADFIITSTWAPLELELEQCDWHKGALLLGKHAWQPKRLQEYLCISEYTITGQKSKQITRIYGFLLLILLCVPWLDCKVVLLHSYLASTYHWRCSVSAISETKTPLDSAKLQPLRSSFKRCLFDSSLVEAKAEFSNY